MNRSAVQCHSFFWLLSKYFRGVNCQNVKLGHSGIFVQLCRKDSKFLAFNINLNGFKYHASLESFLTYLTLSLITQFNGHSFWRKKLCLVQQLSRRATMNRMFYFRGELAQISLLDKLYLNILQQKILWVSLAIVCQKMKKKNIGQ